MEDTLKERAEKCSAYDKGLFTKGRQDSYHDTIVTIANLVVLLEFICDETESSKTPLIITMLQGVDKLLVKPDFRSYVKKNKYKIP